MSKADELSSDDLDAVAGGAATGSQSQKKPVIETTVEVTADGTTRFTTTAHVGATVASNSTQKATS